MEKPDRRAEEIANRLRVFGASMINKLPAASHKQRTRQASTRRQAALLRKELERGPAK